MAFRVLMYAIIAFHFLVIGYLVVGGFLALKWPKSIVTHVAMSVWGILIVTVPTIICPLTWSENWARRQAGLVPYSEGFIDRYIENVWYPAWLTPYVQTLVALIVLASWVLLISRRRKSMSGATADRPAGRT
jgi:uncharacterized protein DUF2784